MIYALIPLIAFGGGLIQAVTGFGAGIFMMLFFPSLFAMNVAPAISGAISTPTSAAISWRYRKKADYKKTILPILCYMAASFIAIDISTKVDLGGLKIFFGLFLMFIGLFNLFFASKIHIKGGWQSAVVCGTLSGLTSGFFGIGGPFMVIYYLAVIEDKEEYLGTINALFLVTGLYQIIVRIFHGILTVDLLPIILLGIAGSQTGRLVGSRIVDRIDGARLKKYIYAFLIIAGGITVVKCLLG